MSDLQRFITAQEHSYLSAMEEIKGGKKRSHWMWYIFPQIRGLGFSETSRLYGIKDLEEATAYFQHPVLGPRLIAICSELLRLQGNDAQVIFGYPDHLKLKSSMTLFSSLPDTEPIFQAVLDKFFNGKKDNKTLHIISFN